MGVVAKTYGGNTASEMIFSKILLEMGRSETGLAFPNIFKYNVQPLHRS